LFAYLLKTFNASEVYFVKVQVLIFIDLLSTESIIFVTFINQKLQVMSVKVYWTELTFPYPIFSLYF